MCLDCKKRVLLAARSNQWTSWNCSFWK